MSERACRAEDQTHHVFADASGELTDHNQRVVVLATLVVTGQRLQSVNSLFESLKDRVNNLGLDISRPDFEFHTQEILQGSGRWRALSEDERLDILRAMKATLSSNMQYAMVVIHKDRGGERGIDDFHKYVRLQREEALSQLTGERRGELASAIRRVNNKKGFGALGDALGLLFGLTTGLLHWQGVEGQAKMTVDNQLLKQIEGWQLLFQLNAAQWPELARRNQFPSWPKDNQPDWHLGSIPHPEDSCGSYGLQLVDFIAYTTARIRRDPYYQPRYVAVANEHDFIPFQGYQGIDLVLSRGSPGLRVMLAKQVWTLSQRIGAPPWKKKKRW